MLVNGKRDHILRSTPLFSKQCPNCDPNGVLELRVLGRYFHLFWIPFFAVGKRAQLYCKNCDEVFEYNEMPPALQQEYNLMAAEVKTPYWFYLGLFLTICGATYEYDKESKGDQRDWINLSAPQAGDLYEIKLESGYTYWRVRAVNGDTIKVSMNSLTVESESELDDINKPEYYSEALIPLITKELLEKFRNGELVNAYRK